MPDQPKNPPAFPRMPFSTHTRVEDGVQTEVHPAHEGMTLWDYYAAHALADTARFAAMNANPSGVALHAAMVADALLAEREKRGL